MTDWLPGDCVTDWLTDWLKDRLSDWLIVWLSDWLTVWLTDWLTDWLSFCLSVWIFDWKADRLIVWYGLSNWRIVLPSAWRTDWLAGLLKTYLIDWLNADLLAIELVGLTDRVTDCLSVWLTVGQQLITLSDLLNDWLKIDWLWCFSWSNVRSNLPIKQCLKVSPQILDVYEHHCIWIDLTCLSIKTIDVKNPLKHTHSNVKYGQTGVHYKGHVRTM